MYVYCISTKWAASFWGATHWTISPSYTSVVLAIPLNHQRVRSKLWWQTLIDVLRGLGILELCSKGTWMDTSVKWHCEGYSLWRLGQNLSDFHLHSIPDSLAVQSTPKAKRTCLLTFLDIRNTISLCLRFCCMNKLASSFQKMGLAVRNSTVISFTLTK